METERKENKEEWQQKINLFKKTISICSNVEKESMMTLFFLSSNLIVVVYLTFLRFKRAENENFCFAFAFCFLLL